MTARERVHLKARAHALDVVVHAGSSGVTDTLVAEVDRALTAHELINVRVLRPGRRVPDEPLHDFEVHANHRVIHRCGIDGDELEERQARGKYEPRDMPDREGSLDPEVQEEDGHERHHGRPGGDEQSEDDRRDQKMTACKSNGQDQQQRPVDLRVANRVKAQDVRVGGDRGAQAEEGERPRRPAPARADRRGEHEAAGHEELHGKREDPQVDVKHVRQDEGSQSTGPYESGASHGTWWIA